MYLFMNDFVTILAITTNKIANYFPWKTNAFLIPNPIRKSLSWRHFRNLGLSICLLCRKCQLLHSSCLQMASDSLSSRLMKPKVLINEQQRDYGEEGLGPSQTDSLVMT